MTSKIKITSAHFNRYLSPFINFAIQGCTERTEYIAKLMLADESVDSDLKKAIEHSLNTKPKTITLPSNISGLLHNKNNYMELENIVMSAENRSNLESFLQQYKLKDALKTKYNLTPSNRILMHGAPGNGKTSIASAIAKELDIPYFVMDFSTIISSSLGGTGAQIAKVFDFVSTLDGCVLFLDELDTVLTERAGFNSKHDVTEMSRVVTTLLMQIDRMPSSVILVGATNHHEMLDKAVSRRFENTWHISNPDDEMVREFMKILTKKINIPLSNLILLEDLKGLSISDIENMILIKARGWAIDDLLKDEAAGNKVA